MLNNLQINFSEPYWLLLTPVSLVLLVIMQRRGRHYFASMSHWLVNLSRDVYRHPKVSILENNKSTKPGKRLGSSIIPLLNLLVVILLFSLTLAQPYRIGKRLPDPPQHRDVVFLIDTSVSMVLRDYVVDGQRIDRLTMLKNVLTHFVDNLQGNRIQFIAYAEQAYTLVPLTNDYALLKFQLQRLRAASLTGRGTDLSHALLYAASVYPQTTSDDAKPVFVMLTDASRPDRRIDPRVVAELIAERGIRLHTIAIGAASYDAEDTKNITLIYHPASFQLLEDIARLGQGRFFWAKDTDSLSAALLAIQAAEKRETTAEPVFIQHPLYYWPLFAALSWLFLLYIVALVRRGRPA